MSNVEVEEALIMCGEMHLMSSKIFRPTRNRNVQFQCDLDEKKDIYQKSRCLFSYTMGGESNAIQSKHTVQPLSRNR